MEKRVIGYARVSTEKQDLERQKNLIKEYCTDRGYELTKIISEKVSGIKKNRQSISELLSMDSSVADMVGVSELSRISRQKELMSVLYTINEILDNGLDVLFLDDTSKVYSAHAELKLVDIITLTVKAHSAAEERDKIATRMRTGKLTKVNSNPYAYAGGIVPYGFKVIDNPNYSGQKNNIPAKKLMVIDELKVKDIHLIYQLVLNGTTLRDAAKKMNSMGLVTQHNKPFCETSISKIIKNPIYNGRRRFKRLDLQLEKIISDEDWNRAQVCVSENQLFKEKSTKNFNPLKGLVFCPCGYALMLHKMVRRDGSSYFVLACCKKNDKAYRLKCRNTGIISDILFKSVWACVKSTLLLSEYEVRNKTEITRIAGIIDTLNNKIESYLDEIDTYRADMGKLAKTITLVSAKGLIEQYQSEYIGLESKVNQLQDNIKSVKKDIALYNSEIKLISDVEKNSVLAGLTDRGKSEVYKKVLSRVVYYSEDIFRGFIVISYKNGLENIVAVKKTRMGYASFLPSTFSFDIKKRKILVPIHQLEMDLKSISISNVINSEYSFKELERVYDLIQWDIAK